MNPEVSSAIEGSSAIYALFTAALPKSFRAKGYASSSGRLDVIARSIMNVAAIEPSAAVIALFGGLDAFLLAPPRCCERATEMEIMTDMLIAVTKGAGAHTSLFYSSVDELLDRISVSHPLVLLKEAGGIGDIGGKKAFFLGSNVDMPASLEQRLIQRGAASVSVGPFSLHADHVIAFIAWLRSRQA